MTEGRKAELAKLCAVQIRQATVLMKSTMADYGYHFVESVFDAEFWSMIPRLADKPVTEADMPLLRELTMEDLWPRLKAAHREHREVAFERLVSENHDLVVRDAELAFDIGWIPLVYEAVERMRTYPKSWRARLDGGKEKFGCLVPFVSFMVDERGAAAEIERMREESRLRSLATCEICGESGRLRLGGYAKTVCVRHAAIFEGFQEDDGRWADPWKWHEDADHSRDLDPGRPRPKHHVDLMPQTPVAQQIRSDIERNYGRKADLLLEFGAQIETAVVAAMSVADGDVSFWLRSEIERWHGVPPLSDDDRTFLRRYLRSLSIDERGRRQRREDENN